jgi:hypothetical protein
MASLLHVHRGLSFHPKKPYAVGTWQSSMVPSAGKTTPKGATTISTVVEAYAQRDHSCHMLSTIQQSAPLSNHNTSTGRSLA